MTARAFKTAAAKPEPYVFDYNREVADFYREHPEQKKKTFFIDASELPVSLLRGDETDEDEISALLVTDGDLYVTTNKAFEDGSTSLSCGDGDYGCILLNLPRDQKEMALLGWSPSAEEENAFTLDHEIGHRLCQKNTDPPNARESAADAYAALRLLQRFGTGAALVEKLARMRAIEMIFFDETHFTSPVVEQIVADSKKINFSALSPQQTVEMARRYAQDYAMQPMFIKYIASNLAAPAGSLKALHAGNFEPLKKLSDIVLTTQVAEEFKCGAAAIRAFLDGQVSYNSTRFPLPLGEEWMHLREALDARAAVFDLPQPKLIVSYGSNQLK